MILIIGLGNPGRKYEKTRHNIAWIIFDSILEKVEWNKSSKGNFLFYKTFVEKQSIEYIKPQTFMNNSGDSVSYAQRKYEIVPQDIIVIHDDIDLPVGKIRISYDHGDGGHNGVKSIINHLGSQSFIRVRIGVSILDENNILRKPNVLSNFSKAEFRIINKDIIPLVNEIIKALIEKGKEFTMNKFNTT